VIERNFHIPVGPILGHRQYMPMLRSTQTALLHILERPTIAWVARLRHQRLAVHAPQIAARVVNNLCLHVRDAREYREVLISEMVRFIDELARPFTDEYVTAAHQGAR
jgi:hypothetical protein